MNQEEVWKKIEDYPNYEVSNMGNVRNIKTGHNKKCNLNNDGYYRICLYKQNKEKTFLIHQLIAQHFIDNPHNYKRIAHIDGNRQNNDIKNLMWETSQQNSIKRPKRQQYASSIYKGVTFFRRDQNWRAYINKEYKQIHIGYFDTELEAAKAYDKEAKKLFGEFANLNIKDENTQSDELTEQLANLNINEVKDQQ